MTFSPGGDTTHTVILDIPAGALSADTTLTIEPAEDPTSSAAAVAGTVYDFGPDGTQFANTVQLTVEYDASNIPTDVPEAELLLYKLINGIWLEVQGSMVNISDKSVTGGISSFSIFGVSGAQPHAQEVDRQTGNIMSCPSRAAAHGLRTL